jgi:hypothetical protein
MTQDQVPRQRRVLLAPSTTGLRAMQKKKSTGQQNNCGVGLDTF